MFTVITTFFSGKLGKVIIALGLIATIVGVLYSGMMYVSNLKGEVSRLEGENSSLLLAVETQAQEAILTQIELKQINESKKSLQNTINKLAEQQTSLQNKFDKIKFNGSERDLGYIAYKKPITFTKIINKATGYALRCAEIASGSPLTEEDSKNTECPIMIEDIQSRNVE